MTHTNIISSRLNLPFRGVENTLELLKEGATIPFIARYRKERTGSLDELQIGDIQKLMQKLVEFDDRKATILKSIEEQGKLSPELKSKIESCHTLSELEDLYLPYKPKRKTRASMAKEKGLEPLADILVKQTENNVEGRAARFLNEEVLSVEDALQGARDIIAEWVNEDTVARTQVRNLFSRTALIHSKVARNKEEEGKKFRDYFSFDEKLNRAPSHRILAIFRGEEEGFLRVSIQPEEEDALHILNRIFLEGNSAATHQVELAIKDAYKRLLRPALETEFRNQAKDKADEEAIQVFSENLEQLLLTPPLGQKPVLAIDPGYRTGCKVVCLDRQGELLANTTIYPHPPQMSKMEAESKIRDLVHKYKIEAVAIGNGTAGRETEDWIRKISFSMPIQVYMVNENGASIYSASAVAREEFPDHDITVRGAVSIGRRLMDPLAELVKIDAKSIGVGQYQHDVNQSSLKQRLDRVVELCVNQVGVNLNTASKHILTYISGLGPSLAQNIVDFRRENGPFKNRIALKKVPRLGAKAFEQAAGFLRIKEGTNPLDNSAVHPESYGIVKQMAKDIGNSVGDILGNEKALKTISLSNYVNKTVGLPTLKDIQSELLKPGLDPRGEAKLFQFAQGVHSIEDLRIGMVIPGLVTNITNFGAFVDVGVKQDGLVHISQLANRYVSNPTDVVKLNQEVEVKVMEVDIERNRINLSMKAV